MKIVHAEFNTINEIIHSFSLSVVFFTLLFSPLPIFWYIHVGYCGAHAAQNIIYTHSQTKPIQYINILLFISFWNPQLKRIQSPSTASTSPNSLLSLSWKIYLLSWPNVYCMFVLVTINFRLVFGRKRMQTFRLLFIMLLRNENGAIVYIWEWLW